MLLLWLELDPPARAVRAASSQRRLLTALQLSSAAMARPHRLPHLNPRQPHRVLAWHLQKLRLAHGWTGKQLAEAYGCSPARISRIEQGDTKPSRMFVLFCEEAFEADGLLMSQFEVAEHAEEQERRRWGGKRPRLYKAIPGDASRFVGHDVPVGTLMSPGKVFEETWRVENSGSVPWRGRRLERQGPTQGPGLITSERFVAVPDTGPGETAAITATLKAPTYDCTSIAYFKQVDDAGQLCFPDNYQLGLDVLVMVRGQKPDDPPLIETEQ
jgi:transcriptional regulator with XRE-family HTH domain